MTARKPFLLKSMASIIDQVMLSGLNFLIGIALIRYASKETYGLYSQIFAGGLLTTTLLEALIGSALTTLAARLEPTQREQLVARCLRLHWMAAAGLATVFGVGVWALSGAIGIAEDAGWLGLVFAFLIFSLGSREYCRTAFFIESRPEVVVRLDAAFVALTLLGALAFLLVEHITVTQVICLLALTNLLAVLPFVHTLFKAAGSTAGWQAYRSDAQALWSLSRWALIGSVIGWLVNNSYLYFAGGLVGVAALADLNAARLLLIPISIIGLAWSRVARPTLGQLVNAADWAPLQRFLAKSVLAMEGFTVIYVAGLLLMFPWLSTHVLGAKYQNVVNLVFLWGIYFAVNAARNVTTTLLTSYGAFRALFWQGIASLPVLVLVCVSLIPVFGVKGALAAMLAVEAFELVVNWFYLIPQARLQKLALE